MSQADMSNVNALIPSTKSSIAVLSARLDRTVSPIAVYANPLKIVVRLECLKNPVPYWIWQ